MTQQRPASAGGSASSFARRSYYERRPAAPSRRNLWGVQSVPPKPVTPKKVALPVARGKSSPWSRRPSRSMVLKREAIAHRPVIKTHRHRSVRSTTLGVLAALLFLFGVGVGVNGLRTNHAVARQVKQLSQSAAVAGASTANASTDVPSEDKPDGSIDSYRVAAALPRTITSTKIGLHARVLRTTVNARNELGAPPNIFDTSWYDGSAKPGEPGAMLIDGHVSGPTQSGVFYNLKKLVAGDKLSVERGDGKVFTYTVVLTKVYDANNVDMAAAITPIVIGRPGLNLMTCAGKIDSSGTHFQQRLVVFASQD